MAVTTGAHAQSPALPSFRLSAQSSTVSPSSPELASVYGTPTSPVASAPSARITTLARALENNPDRIYQFVRNTITFEPQFGLHKGADGVLLDGSGGAFDQAQLMIELLRAAGVSARYVLGTVNLGAEAATVLRVDTAKQACELLATAGTPALVNGTTACSSLSGAVSTVQMSHVWVEASIGGAWYAFDPALKQSAKVIGIDLWAASGTTAAAAWSDISSGVSSGSGDLTGINQSSLNSKMAAYATSLQTTLITSHSDASLEQLTGGWDIARTEAVLRDTTLPAQADVTTRWNDDVPASYRATLTVATAGFNHVYDLASIYAWRVQAQLQGRSLVVAVRKREDQNAEATAYFADSAPSGQPSCDGAIVVCGSDPGQTAFDAQDRRLELTINHPYAAVGGSFADERVVKSIEIGKRVDILVRTAGGTGDRRAIWAAQTDPIQQHRIVPAGDDLNNCYLNNDGIPPVVGECDGRNAVDWRYYVQDVPAGVPSSARLFPRGEVAVAEMGTRKDRLLNIWTDMFDRTTAIVGPLSGSRIFAQHSIGVALMPSYTENTLDIDTAVGISTSGTDQPRHILSALASLALTEEALAIGQSATERPNFPGISTQATAASRIGIGSGLKILSAPGSTSTLPLEVLADTRAWIERYLDTGYSVVATTAGTENAFLARRADGSEQAWIMRSQTAGATPDVDPRTAFRKGAEPETPNPTDFLGKAEARQLAANVAGAQIGAVDLRSGSLSFGEGSELSIGQGEFPDSLNFTRSYVSTGPIEGSTGLGMGWTHNWESSVSHASDVGALLPDASAVTAAPMLMAALVAIQAGRADTIEAAAVSGVALDWLQSVVEGNVVNVSGGGRAGHFVRLANGTWRNPASPTETLAKVGGGVINSFDRELIWTLADRSVMTFGDIPNSFAPLLSLGGVAKSWVFPKGVTITWDYGAQNQTNAPVLLSVSNNLGVALGFTHTLSASFNDTNTCQSQAQTTFPNYAYGYRDAMQACYEASTRGGMLTAVQAGPDRIDFTFNRFCPQFVNFCAFQLAQASHPGLRTRSYSYAIPDGALANATLPVSYQQVLTQVADDGVTIPRARFVWKAVGGQVAPYVAETYDAQNRRTTYYPTTFTLSSAKDALDEIVRQTYDEDGRLLASADALGRTARAAYDGVGRTRAVQTAFGDTTSFGYDARGNLVLRTQSPTPGCASGLTSQQQAWWCQTIVIQAEYNTTWDRPSRIVLPATEADPVQRDWLMTYNSQGLLQAQSGPAVLDGVSQTTSRPVWSTTYDAYGRVIGTRDPTGIETARVWGGGGLPAFCLRQATTSSQTGGLNLTTTMGCNAVGDITSVTDPRGKTTTSAFDDLRRKRSETGPVSTAIATEWTYDLDGDLTAERQWDNTASIWRTKTTTYSATHQPLTSTDPSGDVSRTCYDALDRPVAVIDPERRATLTEYNAAGQPTVMRRWYRAALGACSWSAELPAGQTETRWRRMAYNAGGLLQSETDANGNVTQSVYDGLGRPARTVYADGSEAWAVMDPRGQSVLSRQRSGSFAAVRYDPMGRDDQVREYAAADADAPLRGRVTRAEYDLAGRPVRRSVSTQTTTGSTFDASLERDIRTYAYDPAGRVVSEAWRPDGSSAGPLLTTGYGYDAASNRTSIVWPGAFTATWGFDDVNRSTSVSFPANGVTQVVGLSYDSLGRRTGINRPGPAADTTYAYEPDSDLSGLGHAFVAGAGTPGGTSFAYGHDAAGKLLSIATNQPVFDWAPSVAYGRTYGAANALNQVASEAGVPISFNLDANMISDGVTTYGWTYGNRLESATRSGMAATYGYDGDNRRTARTVNGTLTRTLWSGADELAEIDASGATLRRFIPDGSGGPDARLGTVDGLGNVYWHHANHQGSVIATSDASGQAVGTASYSPYGEFGSGVSAPPVHSPFGYTGRQYDPETGLYQYRARYYSPRLGQFLSTDPVGTKDDPNLTLYVANDPVNRTDPTGRESFIVGRRIFTDEQAANAGRAAYVAAGGGVRGQIASAAASAAVRDTKHAFLVITAEGTDIGQGRIEGIYSYGPTNDGTAIAGMGDTSFRSDTGDGTNLDDIATTASIIARAPANGVSVSQIGGVSNMQAAQIFGAKSESRPYSPVPGAVQGSTNSNSEAFARGQAAATAGGSTFAAPAGIYPGAGQAGRVICPSGGKDLC